MIILLENNELRRTSVCLLQIQHDVCNETEDAVECIVKASAGLFLSYKVLVPLTASIERIPRGCVRTVVHGKFELLERKACSVTSV